MIAVCLKYKVAFGLWSVLVLQVYIARSVTAAGQQFTRAKAWHPLVNKLINILFVVRRCRQIDYGFKQVELARVHRVASLVKDVLRLVYNHAAVTASELRSGCVGISFGGIRCRRSGDTRNILQRLAIEMSPQQQIDDDIGTEKIGDRVRANQADRQI